jgi:poly(3-hydroxybutyrate) depolymerase
VVKLLAIPLAVLSLGLGLAGQAEQDLRGTLTVDGRERGYRVFVPEGRPSGAGWPAVVLYNGSGSRVEALWSSWLPLARERGIVLVAPDAWERGAWRIPEDSPDYSRDVVEAVKARFPVDPRRVSLFGHSGGGHHVIQVGLLESEYFAGVAAHAGALVPGFEALLDRAPRKIPAALWIGTDDRVVPIEFVRATRDEFESRNYFVQLTEMPGHGHSWAERADDVVRQAWAFLARCRLTSDPVYQPYRFNGG